MSLNLTKTVNTVAKPAAVARRACRTNTSPVRAALKTEAAGHNRREVLTGFLKVAGVVAGVDALLPGKAFADAEDEATEIIEEEIPEIEEKLTDLPPQFAAAVEKEVEAVEGELSKVEEEIAEGESAEDVEGEVQGIEEQLKAIVSIFGF